MHSWPVARGKRVIAVLEPGDDVIEAILAACREHGIEWAVVPVFLGAFTTVTIIASDGPVEDDDLPMGSAITVEWVEGSGAATVVPDVSGQPVVHLHAVVGVKADGGAAVAGHVLAATTHYTAEVVIDEVSGDGFVRRPDPRSHGLNSIQPS